MSGNDLAHNELNFNLCAKMSQKMSVLSWVKF